MLNSKEQLTNEALKKHFKDNFALAEFAISVARYLIKAGHEVDVPQLLKDIQKNPTMYAPDQLAAMEKADSEESRDQDHNG